MENNLQTHVINALRNLLNVNDLTQNDLAEKNNLTRQTISNYFTNRTDLTLNMAERLANSLGVPVVKVVENYQGAFSPTVTGNRNKTQVTGGNYTVTRGPGAEIETENKYLKQLIKEKDEQIRLLKSLIK